DNFFDASDPDQASTSVIVDSLLLMGMEKLTGGDRAFINCTRNVLIKGYAALLPKDKVVVEILESVEPDDEVVGACLRLKRAGFMLALDDFIYEERLEPLLPLIDFVKVDFRETTEMDRRALVEKLSPRGIKMVAEKVETRSELQQASEMGYTYFQGYFFSKPEIVVAQDIPGYKLNYLRVLQAVNQPEINLVELENIIKLEASLTYKLLRYLNSAFFGFRTEIRSIHHALALLGEEELKKWASLIAMAAMGADKPPELVVSVIVRAVFCESLAPKIGMTNRSNDLFLLGMMSLIDAVLDRPLPEILEKMPISHEVKEALLGVENRFRDVYETVIAYEAADWRSFAEKARKLNLDEETVPDLYLKSVEWAKNTFHM
ncbi:MAG: HDOD domain-containing protein, partial [Acidobacteria bacterium]|nr:HDOD domain-containing protein [Acidobacteriota bacterium]